MRLNDLGEFKKGPFGSSLTKSMFVPESYPNRIKVYEQKNAIQKNALLGNYFISNDKFQTMLGFIVEPGDIIVSCAGTIGEIYILPANAETGIINQALMRVKLYYKFLENYFLMYFDSVLKKEASDKGNGTGMKNIPPFDILKKMLMPIPPESEMVRILDKINCIQICINEIKTNEESIEQICINVKKKILEYYFGDNSSYKSYYENNSLKLVKLYEICNLNTGNSINKEDKSKKYTGIDFGIPYIGTKDLSANHQINYENGVLIPTSELSNFILAPKNSVLLCIEGGSAGKKIAITDREVCFGNKLCCFAPKSVLTEYLYFYLQSPIFKNAFQNQTSGLIGGVGINKLRNIEIFLPCIEQQNEVIKSIKKIFDIIDKIVY